jgi:hypothetical protein
VAPLTPEEEAKMRETLLRHGWQLEDINKRLNVGAENFTNIRRSQASLERELQEVKTPKPIQTWRMAGFVLTVVVMVAGWIWAAARYPDREEYNALERELRTLREQAIERHQDLREGDMAAQTDRKIFDRRLIELEQRLDDVSASAATTKRKKR